MSREILPYIWEGQTKNSTHFKLIGTQNITANIRGSLINQSIKKRNCPFLVLESFIQKLKLCLEKIEVII